MRKLFALIAVAALGLGGLASDAGANSITFVLTGPASIVEGQTTTFNVVMQIDPNVAGATFQVDVLGVGITSATNNMTGTNGFTSNFNLRELNFVAFPGSVCVGGANPTCTVAAPGAPSAGNAGGLSGSTFNAGTYTLGSYTVVGLVPGGADVSVRIRPGFAWLDGALNDIAPPTSNVLHIDVTPIPEPATAGLIGLGLVGLVLAGRRSRA
jgi:hypothetical protein